MGRMVLAEPTAPTGDVATGDQVAALFEAFAPLILRFAQRRVGAAAWDVVDETFLVAWRRVEALPKEPAEQLPWLYAVASNVVRNTLRGEARRERLDRRLAATVAGERSTDPADVVAEMSGPDRVIAALNQLAETDREILRLVAWERLDLASSAAVLGITYNATKVRLHRARRRLEQLLVEPTQLHAPDPAKTSPPKDR